MKKYLFGFFALICALAFSAYTYPSKTKKATTEDALYWYTIGGDGKLAVQQNQSPLTKTEAMTGATAITDCPDDSSAPLCLVGTDSPDDEGQPAGSPVLDHRIKEVFIP
jgi:hypothetical protein